MTNYLGEEERDKIDAYLKKEFESNPSYGEFMDRLIETEELSVREKIVAAFVAGETTTRLSLTDKILGVLK